MSTKETIPVPFPVDEDPAHTVDVFSGYWKGMDKIYERARVEEVKLDDLVASQEAVDLPYVKKLLKAKKYNDPKRMLILRMPDKTLKIDDGHHTLTAAKLAGLQKVKALVTDIYEEELVKNNMKSSLKELASLLVEQTLSEDDASPDGVFGKWLFGPEQIDAAANKEKNTDIEGDLNSALYKHYIGSPNPDLGKLYFKYVKPELEKGNYTKYLKPPEGYVYRGMTLSSTGFAKIVKIAKHELQDVKSMGKGWYMAQAGVMTPPGSKARSMSWTTDEKQAAKFASTTGDNVNGAKVYAIFTADTNNSENNFMVNPNKVKAGYKDKSVFNQYKEEKEVISVGPVNFIECTFYIDFHKNAVKVSK